MTTLSGEFPFRIFCLNLAKARLSYSLPTPLASNTVLELVVDATGSARDF
jgi:hypothetical protein